MGATIHDATGAAAPNAAVTVINFNSGSVATIAPNGSGNYEVPSLPVAEYSLEMAAPGFGSPFTASAPCHSVTRADPNVPKA